MKAVFPNAWAVQPEAWTKLSVDQAEDLTIFGETARLLFGKDQPSVDNNLKNTAAAGNQFGLYIRTKGTM